MSISLANMRTKLDGLIGNVIDGQTSAAGATDGTTAIDNKLVQYPDDYLKDRFLYIVVAAEERKIKGNSSSDGTIVVWTAFSAQVGINTVYQIRLFSVTNEKIALNNALGDTFPYFYNPHYDTTLYGQNAYGEEDEFNKYLYTVPAAFIEFPSQMWLFEAYTGKHDGADAAAALTDSRANWIVNELKDLTIYNKTDKSSATVTANTATTITATLAGGTDNAWDRGDEYIIQKPNKIPIAFHDYTVVAPVTTGQYEFYASIPENYLLGLMGKAYLSQFTTDASVTELTDAQAQVVCLKAAANLYEMYAAKASAEDAGRFEIEAAKFNGRFHDQKRLKGMPSLHKMTLNWDWLK